jgi:hypothetical protein
MSSRPLTSCLALLALGLVSCRGGAPSGDRTDDRPGGDPTSPRPAAEASAATQHDLARELDAVDHAADPASALAALRDRWQGQHLTWTVTRHAALCRSADACHVIPFAAPHRDGESRHGWLPALALAPDQFAALSSACGPAACQITFAGDLAELAVSDELPTRLRFTNIEIITATAAIAIPSRAGG